jgi:hypothetical protein
MEKIRLFKRRFMSAVIIGFVTLLPFGSVQSENLKPIRLTGTFSNLRYIPEAGDLLGEEVRLFYTSGGMTALVQIAEGGPGEATIEHVSVTGDHIMIELTHRDDGIKRFEGDITTHALRGNFINVDGGSNQVVMKRTKSYWD